MKTNRYPIILIAIILFFSQPVFGQMEVDVSRSEFKTQKEGFRSAWFHVREGNRLANKGKGAYSLALKEYLQAYQYNSDNGELNFKIGTCCLQTDKKREAIIYLNKAYFTNPQIIRAIHFLLARAYHQNLEFENAIKEYDLYYSSLKNRDKRKIGPTILKYKEECLNAKDLVSNPKRVIIRNLGDSVNSFFDDYNSVFSSGDSLMYFISRRPALPTSKPSLLDYRYNEDIYYSIKDSNNWRKATRWDVKFNNKHHNGVVWVSADDKTVFLYNGYKKNGDLQCSKYRDGRWTRPSKFKGGFNSGHKESSLSMTADGNEIYFVSEKPKESIGGKDIFYSTRDAKGKWSAPVNVGATINTIYDEEGVYIRPDGKVLYFSSKGHNNIGGYDIFKVEKDEKNAWSKPQNLGYPLNTPDDELYFRPEANEKQAYYSGTRPDSKGGKDIYKVIFLGTEKEMMLLSEDQLISYKDKPYSDIFIRLPQEISIDTTIILKGTITDSKSNKPIQARMNLIDIEKSLVVATTISDTTGNYRISLPKVKNYGVEINAKDYMFLLDVVNIPPNIKEREVYKNFVMAKLEAGVKVVLKNIYFQTGKATLKAESYAELDKVLKFLQENTDLKIEISGHTDNVGSLKANTNLSEARAKAVVEYLTSRGIPVDRLVFKGYAFNQPIAPNNTAEGRKVNRRVEFKILSVE